MHNWNSFPQLSDFREIFSRLSQQDRAALDAATEDLHAHQPVKPVQPKRNLTTVGEVQRTLQVDDESQDPVQVLRFSLDIVLFNGAGCGVKQTDDFVVAVDKNLRLAGTLHSAFAVAFDGDAIHC